MVSMLEGTAGCDVSCVNCGKNFWVSTKELTGSGSDAQFDSMPGIGDYIVNKMNWGEITKAKERKANNWGGARQESQVIKDLHEEWAIKNGYRDNDNLHATNTERFVNYEK